MAQCPECQNEVGDDFGLVTCANCGASLFVDMEGQAVSNQGEESPPPLEAEPEEFTQPLEAEDFNEALHEPTQALDPLEAVEQEEAVWEGPGADEDEPSQVGEFQFEDPVEDEPRPVYAPAPTSSDLADVVDFANSDLSQARDGNLKYHLKLSGIDTMDLRNAVKEALTDRRFIWDTEAMVRGIRDGILEIDQISAVKAFLLISRVSFLPLKIEWVQQPLNQP
jgi:hypothetical protein